MANFSQVVSNQTLEDGAWKDTFDKLLDDRPVLRDKNLLKSVVRASYNLNSSVESGSKDNANIWRLGIPSPTFKSHGVPGRRKNKKRRKRNSPVATPVGNQARNLFKCSLSPIGVMKLTYFGHLNNKKDLSLDKLHSTAINSNVVVDYGATQGSNQNQLRAHIDTTPKTLLSPIPLQQSSCLRKSKMANGRGTVFAKKMAAILSEKDSFEMPFIRTTAVQKHPSNAKRGRLNRATAGKNSSLKVKRGHSIARTTRKKSSEVQEQVSSALATGHLYKVQPDGRNILTFGNNALAAQKGHTNNSSVMQNQTRFERPAERASLGDQRLLSIIVATEKSSLELLTEGAVEMNAPVAVQKCSSVLVMETESGESVQVRSSEAVSKKSSLKPQKESTNVGATGKDSLKSAPAKKKVVIISKKTSNEVQTGCSNGIDLQSSSTEETRGRLVAMSSRASKENLNGLVLQSGKWRKSLKHWRRTSQMHNNQVMGSNCCGLSVIEASVEFVSSTRLVGQRKSVFIKAEQSKRSGTLSTTEWKRRVLQYCKQRQPVDFESVYIADEMKKCRKIGEGVYGEVFINNCQDDASVVKVIPIEGQQMVNGEKQKTFEQIFPEIVISSELSKLRSAPVRGNITCGFVALKKVTCVKGKYPAHMMKLWEQYDNDKGSDNDHPEIFPKDQLYITLELAFGGCDLESYVFNNAEQVYNALLQIILTLAVGEEAFQFEHRDLHWGNVLILRTTEKHLTYKLNKRSLTVPTKGIKVTIIDYTLSRMKSGDCCHYNDLSLDQELFGATGDYQFDIYRMMRDAVKNNWETFEPKTNVFWISYLVSKMLNGVSYKNKFTKVHTMYLTKLRKLQDIVLDFQSAVHCAQYLLKTP